MYTYCAPIPLLTRSRHLPLVCTHVVDTVDAPAAVTQRRRHPCVAVAVDLYYRPSPNSFLPSRHRPCVFEDATSLIAARRRCRPHDVTFSPVLFRSHLRQLSAVATIAATMVNIAFVLHLLFISIGGAQARSWNKKAKHSLKTIQTITGDLFDCVDMYKQPAFDHPLLKNHTLQVFSIKNIIKHLIMCFQSDANVKTGCLNLQCAGFVSTTNIYGPGSFIPQFSTYGGEQKYLSILIARDSITGNWWITYNDELPLGYFPKELLPKMNDYADIIQMGGRVKSPSNVPSPPMGSGHPSNEGPNKAAYFIEIQFIDQSNNWFVLNPKDILPGIDIGDYYNISDNQYVDDKYVFAYGGGGGFK
ncbi:hypothetical protein ZIOFF_017926 [Zingiber officinale]|uniref:Neprosin PEP catalytic domain-containing protein n=1 Tax=Zingiber officinale TaxID=94328 RepID=A0A8J5H7I7_ZINOF|nr:hypothetical protein ZIOFF_017926 [Zingiber officinale]